MSRVPSRIAIVITLLLAALWWSAGSIPQAHAATDTVTDCRDSISTLLPGSLRYVVLHAAAGDTITFACSGTTILSAGRILLTQDLTIDEGRG